MKKLPLIISLFAITLSSFAENGLPEESNANFKSVDSEAIITKPVSVKDFVINHEMIEKFNNAEYSTDQLSFADLVEVYTFQEIKQISQAYKAGDIEVLSDASINQYAKKNLNNDNWLYLYGESKLSENIK